MLEELTRVADLQSTCSNATENDKGFSKGFENFRKFQERAL